LRIYVSCLLYAVRDNLTEASDLSSFYHLVPRAERRARGGDGQLQMVEIGEQVWGSSFLPWFTSCSFRQTHLHPAFLNLSIVTSIQDYLSFSYT
jgi:hypothetical protein